MKKTIEIPVLIGSDGTWMSNGPDPDWGLLADCIMTDGKDPPQSRKYTVRVTLELPPAINTADAESVETVR